MPDRSAFAGSVATTNRLVRTMVQLANVSLINAIRMMTLTPARILHIDKSKGSLESGKDADIVIFLYRDDYYNENTEKPGVCEVNIAKHRSGPTDKIELTWVSRYTKFSDKAL